MRRFGLLFAHNARQRLSHFAGPVARGLSQTQRGLALSQAAREMFEATNEAGNYIVHREPPKAREKTLLRPERPRGERLCRRLCLYQQGKFTVASERASGTHKQMIQGLTLNLPTNPTDLFVGVVGGEKSPEQEGKIRPKRNNSNQEDRRNFERPS